MNLYLRELRAYRKPTLIWALSLSALVVIFLSLYPAFSKDVEAFQRVLESFPEAFRLAFSLNIGGFFTIFGFYGYLLGFAILAGAIQAMNLGVGVISKEVAGKTADFLVSKPISRSRIVTAKLLAVVSALVFTNVVFCAVSYGTALAVAGSEKFDAGTFLLLASTLLLVQLMFLALGMLFSVLLPKVKSVVGVALPTVFAFYIIGMIGEVLENDTFRYISPFRYYDTSYVIKHNALETKYLVIEAVFVVVAIVASYVIYLRKDVRAAA
ncbi:MAG: ABC transporter permease [Coriobacteriia bacterium]